MDHLDSKISIIMAVYNSADTLERSISSIVSQTHPHKELIIIDGASTDGSVEILEAHNDVIDYWESEPDRGIYHAWNKGLAHATGDWIHFHGADDYFMGPEALAQVARGAASADSDIRVVYGKEAVVSRNGDVLELNGIPWEAAGPRFVREMSIPHPTVFHHRSIFRDHGVFDESFRVCADYDLLLRELKTGRALFLPGPVIKAVTYGGASKRWDMILTVAREHARAQRKNGLFPYGPGGCWFLAKTAVKYALAKVLGDTFTRQLVDCYRSLTGRPRIWTKM